MISLLVLEEDDIVAFAHLLRQGSFVFVDILGSFSFILAIERITQDQQFRAGEDAKKPHCRKQRLHLF